MDGENQEEPNNLLSRAKRIADEPSYFGFTLSKLDAKNEELKERLIAKETMFEVDKMLLSWKTHFHRVNNELRIEKELAAKQRDKMNDLRYKFFKDVTHSKQYRDKLESNIKLATENRNRSLAHEFEHIKIHREVGFFKVIEGIDIDAPTREILDHELETVTEKYNQRLKDLLQENKSMF